MSDVLALTHDEETPPATTRARTRLFLLAACVGIWLLPWAGSETGPVRSGAAAALSLLAAWGLGATTLLARTRRGLAVGEAATSAALASLVTILVVAHHPWLPGPDRRATWAPIFGPLALMALLDLVTLVRRVPGVRAIAVLRIGSALVAAAALFVALEPLPAAVALFLAAGPAVASFSRDARSARRGLEALLLLAAVGCFLAPEAQSLLGVSPESGESPTPWAFLWRLLTIALGLFALRGVILPEGGALEGATPVPPASPRAQGT